MNKIKKIFLVLLTTTLVITACIVIAIFSNKHKQDNEIKNIIDSLTLEEKIGQLFIIKPEALLEDLTVTDIDNIESCYEITDEMIETYNQYPCGGFVLFSKNINTESQLINLTNSLHNLNKISPIIAIDEEGGSVSRIANNPNFNVEKFNDMEFIGNTKDGDIAYKVGYTIGSYLDKYGIDLNFAPIADINTNPNNKVIGTRAFGSDPYLVSNMVQSTIFGMHDANTLTTVKHFPGHGDTNNDTHYESAYTNKTWEELKEKEIIPFLAGINANTEMIMVSHIETPNITNDTLPVSLSKEIIENKLRKELEYDGVIITDALEMKAITNNYSSSEAAVKAIEAGVDIILLPEDYKKAYTGLLNAVKTNRISEERIDESLYRIIKLKNVNSLINNDN